MKDDTISRAAALDEVESLVDTMSVCISMDECKGMRNMKQRVLERLKELPSAQQWIMCSPGTMPKMTDIYLVKVSINQHGEGMYPTYRTALWHTVWREWFVHEKEDSIIGEVTAWMPIPGEGE